MRELDTLGRNPAAIAGRLVAAGVSRRSTFRGRARRDGRITLLTVDFANLTPHAIRLANSFRRNVDPTGAVVAVQNGTRANNKRLSAHGIETHGFGLNITHGRALDWGMRFITTEYVLVCDPDSFILAPRFREEVFSRLDRFGVAGITIHETADFHYYHPICTAFETRLWKERAWSWIQDYSIPGRPRDVGWELTEELGGFNGEAAIPRTRTGIAGHVYGESFTCTFGTSRIDTAGHEIEIDGRSAAVTRDYHGRWAQWVDRVAAGLDDVSGFPT